ncbi:MAG: hypothetical protein U7123_12440 [Potamolinea sp.]
MKVNICGVEIDKYTFDELLEAITNHGLSGSTSEYVVTPNAQHILLFQQDAHF